MNKGDLQYLADRLDPIQVPMLVNVGVYLFSSRSSAAWAKKALADFRISLARRNSLFSRSSALMRSCSACGTPDRVPASTSWSCTHFNKVWAEQPILGAIDWVAAHNDEYSPRCSCTNRTARSRTSGENLLVLLMTAFSQEMQPPQNPGRFNLGSSTATSYTSGTRQKRTTASLSRVASHARAADEDAYHA